jgi:hypothetical protein
MSEALPTQQKALLARALRGALIGFVSTVLAIGGTLLTGEVAEANHWCCVHGWALMHGSGLIVGMGWGLLAFHLVTALLARFGVVQYKDSLGLLPNVVYASAALATFYQTEQFLWVGLIAVIVTLVQRRRGILIRPFGLFLFGTVVLVSCLLLWAYMEWLSSASRHAIGG